jgi:hypothetical protein
LTLYESTSFSIERRVTLSLPWWTLLSYHGLH